MMGARLAAQVYAQWSHLHDRPFRLLVHMALTVKDATEKPTYWGGREAMADMLGARGTDESRRQTVKRAIRELTAAGAIKCVYQGHAGKRSEYRITLDNHPEKGVADRTPSSEERGSVNDPQRGSLSDPKGGHSVTKRGSVSDPPRSTEEEEENREEGKSPTKVTAPSAAVQRAKTQNHRLALVRERADREATA